tara:strand:- start:220 stop:705 length:486 start_codon:yes stop_codon:yes gene_type:complete
MIFLGLGTNIGDTQSNLDKVLTYFREDGLVSLIKKSKTYITSPMENKNQENFLNQVILVETKLFPYDLLKYLKSIEQKMGRKIIKQKYMPRIIDIDILVYNTMIYNNNKLVIPHPKIKQRKFVLKPWNDIAPDYVIPNENQSINSLLRILLNSKDLVKEYN